MLNPIHPGEILNEEYLAPLNLTPAALAEATGLPEADLNGLLDGKQGITIPIAERLAAYFDTTPGFWLNLQSGYEKRTAAANEGKKLSEIPHFQRPVVERNTPG